MVQISPIEMRHLRSAGGGQPFQNIFDQIACPYSSRVHIPLRCTLSDVQVSPLKKEHPTHHDRCAYYCSK